MRCPGLKTGLYVLLVSSCSMRVVISKELVMSKVCIVTGKRPMFGNNVSHANNKTRRRFEPNLHSKRFWVESEDRWVRLKVTAKAIKIINKRGIDSVLADLRKRGEKV